MSAEAHRDELELRERLLGGDREAAEEFFGRYSGALYEFISYRVGHDRATAEDLVQESLLAALEGLPEYRGEASLSTWLYGIAKNKIRERRRKRRPVPMEDLLDEVDPEISSILAEIEKTPLPEEILAARETKELVGATLSSLSPDYKQVLLGKYVEGRSVPDMAAQQGRGVKATESTLFRARQAFQRIFTLLADKQGGAS